MNKLILSTGSDLNYLSKMRPYLKSIESNSNFDKNILVYVGEDEMSLPYKNIDVVNLPVNNIQSLNNNKCVQHGDFLNSESFNSITEDSDVIIYTDGDIILQRNLSEDEINFYKSFKDGDVHVGYNASPTDTLGDESKRLGRTNFISSEINIDVWENKKVYNTGVLGMNKKTWKYLLKKYNELYPSVSPMFHHYAKQQWLISYIIGTDTSFNIIEMGYDVHNHRHYPSPKGTTQDINGDVYFNDKKVLFKHKW
jgi:hypothetical protein